MGIKSFPQTARWAFDSLSGYSGKYKCLAPYLGQSILDLGCGSGTLIPLLQEKASYIGIDIAQEHVNILKSQHPHFSFYCLDLDKDLLPGFSGVSFTSIVLIAVIEHLQRPDSILEQCWQIMNDNTQLIITTPTRVGDVASTMIETFWGNLKDPNAHPHVQIYNETTLNSLCTVHHLVRKQYRRLSWHRQNQMAIYTKA
jgi:2-polyprenyl-3-methyl-5-hydroxy-6-metoxy-1,4-benzoquinol methylase